MAATRAPLNRCVRMILLDTNVLCESMKPEPHPSVRDWLDDQAAETLFLSSVTSWHRLTCQLGRRMSDFRAT